MEKALKLAVPTTGATLGKGKTAEFATYKIYDEPAIEGGQPIWFANISFLKDQKEAGEFYLNKLVEVGLHHSFITADEQLDRPIVTTESIASKFAKLMA